MPLPKHFGVGLDLSLDEVIRRINDLKSFRTDITKEDTAIMKRVCLQAHEIATKEDTNTQLIHPISYFLKDNDTSVILVIAVGTEKLAKRMEKNLQVNEEEGTRVAVEICNAGEYLQPLESSVANVLDKIFTIACCCWSDSCSGNNSKDPLIFMDENIRQEREDWGKWLPCRLMFEEDQSRYYMVIYVRSQELIHAIKYWVAFHLGKNLPVGLSIRLSYTNPTARLEAKKAADAVSRLYAYHDDNTRDNRFFYYIEELDREHLQVFQVQARSQSMYDKTVVALDNVRGELQFVRPVVELMDSIPICINPSDLETSSDESRSGSSSS